MLPNGTAKYVRRILSAFRFMVAVMRHGGRHNNSFGSSLSQDVSQDVAPIDKTGQELSNDRVACTHEWMGFEERHRWVSQSSSATSRVLC